MSAHQRCGKENVGCGLTEEAAEAVMYVSSSPANKSAGNVMRNGGSLGFCGIGIYGWPERRTAKETRVLPEATKAAVIGLSLSKGRRIGTSAFRLGLASTQTHTFPSWGASSKSHINSNNHPPSTTTTLPLHSFQTTFVPSSQYVGLYCWPDEAVWKGPEDRPSPGPEGPEMVPR